MIILRLISINIYKGEFKAVKSTSCRAAIQVNNNNYTGQTPTV